MLRRTVDADSIELSGCWAGHSHQSKPVLVLACLQRL